MCESEEVLIKKVTLLEASIGVHGRNFERTCVIVVFKCYTGVVVGAEACEIT